MASFEYFQITALWYLSCDESKLDFVH